MSDSTDGMVSVRPRGAWLSWAAVPAVCASLLFAGGAIVRFELHARHLEQRQDETDKKLERLDTRREDAGQAMVEVRGELKSIRERLTRIENKLDAR